MKKMLCMILSVFVLASCNESEKLSSKHYKLEKSQNDAPITIGFDVKENRYFGSVVNRYFGKYKLEGDKITFAPGGATMMMGPPALMDAERDFFAVLPKIVSYKLDGEKLTLIMDDGQELLFIETDEVK